ncbi:hypothetical protein B296_00047832 [Ensete ventricosum]|uniref:Uncharacterized protein n=1 Tax=Ensete ventricosum TaxID=4639 RepID=A0A426Y520_ENSVE|nr:hypothetical protein B296_00047832 [Ensete ventricosum]
MQDSPDCSWVTQQRRRPRTAAVTPKEMDLRPSPKRRQRKKKRRRRARTTGTASSTRSTPHPLPSRHHCSATKLASRAFLRKMLMHIYRSGDGAKQQMNKDGR